MNTPPNGLELFELSVKESLFMFLFANASIMNNSVGAFKQEKNK